MLVVRHGVAQLRGAVVLDHDVIGHGVAGHEGRGRQGQRVDLHVVEDDAAGAERTGNGFLVGEEREAELAGTQADGSQGREQQEEPAATAGAGGATSRSGS